MAHHRKRRYAVILVYLALITGIAWQSFALVEKFGPHGKFAQIRSYKVSVQGDVRRPGLYRVPEGTTQFEILKVAGVRPTSDLSGFNLMNAAGENSEIAVGSRPIAGGIKQQAIMVRLEFYFGDVTITGKDGRNIPTQEGIALSEGDRVQTDLSSQAELSLGSFSRVDIDAFADLVFDNTSIADDGSSTLNLFQKAGACWYKIAYGGKGEAYQIVTPNIVVTVSGNNADFLLDIQPDRTIVNLTDGQLRIDRTSGAESVNLITGQSANIFNDGRPIQVSRLAPDMSAAERFSQLSQERKTQTVRGQPLNFSFLSTPFAFFVVSAQFEKGIIYTIHIPPRLMIEQYAEGIQTIDEAYLYGGPALVNSLLERILTLRLTRYAQFTRDNILKTADILGGINASIDQKSSAQLKMSAGSNRLNSQNLATYLSPASSSPEEAEVRQRQLLGDLIKDLRDKKIVLNATNTSQILGLIESNFTTQEVLDYSLRLSTSGDLKHKDVNLPVKEQRVKGRLVYEPDLDKCREIIGE
jgi:hypothetical protein